MNQQEQQQECSQHWIDLRYKQMPSDEGANPTKLYSIYKRGINIDGLRTMLSDKTVWTTEWQSVHNATTIARAFHDDLGVKSIPLVFCDDILSGDVVRLPLWNTWESLLNPIFSAAGFGRNHQSIQRRKIIRCLFAHLPSGKEIPVHHDTGYWSMNSHRVHVPIITSEQTFAQDSKEVEFYSGQTTNNLVRCPFEESSIVELNNRAKHMVKNNWEKTRIHMIFDFVEDDVAARLTCIDIKPGMEIKQTRRTLMLSADGGVENSSSEGSSAQDYASILKNVGFIADAEEQTKRTKDITAFIEKMADDKVASAIRLDTIMHGSRCYGRGEVPENIFIRQLLSVFPEKEFRMLFEEFELHRLIPDEERRMSLVREYVRSKSEDGHCRIASPFPKLLQKSSLKPAVYFLIGAMKCGTTSLHSYVHQHPNCLPAHRQKEPHILDWKWNMFCASELSDAQNKLAVSAGLVDGGGDAEENAFYLRSKFATALVNVDELKKSGLNRNASQCFMGDATPSYLLGGSVIARRAYAVAPNAKIIVILRDPVPRALSQFAMISDSNCTPEQRRRRGSVAGKTFDDVVNEDLDLLKFAKIHPASIFQHFESRYSAKTPYGHGSHSFIGRGLYSLQLEGWLDVFPPEQFCILFLEDLSVDSDDPVKSINKAMESVWKHLGQDHTGGQIVKEIEKKNVSKVKVTMKPEMETKLRSFYKPHNERLQRLLVNVAQRGGYVSSNGMRYVESWCA